MTELTELLKHVDYFFEPISHTYNPNLKFEVYLRDGKWTVTHPDDEVFGTTDSDAVVQYLVNNSADIHEFHHYVREIVLNKAVLCMHQLHKYEQILGPDAILDQSESWDNFAENIGKLIKKTIDKKKLHIVR